MILCGERRVGVLVGQQRQCGHWFKQLEDGSTEITSADLDETGAYGDWPEDFDDIMLESENRYITAVEDKMLEGN